MERDVNNAGVDRLGKERYPEGEALLVISMDIMSMGEERKSFERKCGTYIVALVSFRPRFDCYMSLGTSSAN